MANTAFTPVIIGANIHAYAAAASFHEDYQKESIVVAAGKLAFTELSSLTEAYIIEPELYQDEVFIRTLNEIAEKYGQQKLLLVATTDEYVKLLIKHSDSISERFILNFPSQELFDQFYYKKHFYQLCEQYGLDIPKTFTIDCHELTTFHEEVMFPVIIKVNDGTAYFDLHFPGKQKIYRLTSYDEVNQTIKLLYDNGYRKDLILQEYIEGNDQELWDMVYYSDRNGKGQVVTLAQVLSQEPQLTAVGNYTALITRYQKELMDKAVRMMEDTGYKGFANFDLKYDARNGKFKFLEVNLRAGRSSSYVRESGYSIARCYVEDLIEHKSHPLVYLDKKMIFTVIPPALILQGISSSELKEEVRGLIKQGRTFNPLKYKKDRSLKRKIYLKLRDMNYFKKYRNREWEQS
ncbi:carboxylate--amine ligase [Macrococcus brunensis]|uniref:Carboxylate--amine ligase n=1 Tax=Macrococcus brunensis TaxID=198483 RepID=A0A4R6BBH8_9STAP|nr:carboxylate--amine ligase [Macrococcus brunensis]TDL94325.1 carboxylate--amine ligase [Macrococcus brunensis]